jgi:hypothetical protein
MTQNYMDPYSNQRRRDRSHGFQPQPTTVHNVALIPNYFESGEEDNESGPQYYQQQQPYH